jgi:hypothetical protein
MGAVSRFWAGETRLAIEHMGGGWRGEPGRRAEQPAYVLVEMVLRAVLCMSIFDWFHLGQAPHCPIARRIGTVEATLR